MMAIGRNARDKLWRSSAHHISYLEVSWIQVELWDWVAGRVTRFASPCQLLWHEEVVSEQSHHRSSHADDSFRAPLKVEKKKLEESTSESWRYPHFNTDQVKSVQFEEFLVVVPRRLTARKMDGDHVNPNHSIIVLLYNARSKMMAKQLRARAAPLHF